MAGSCRFRTVMKLNIGAAVDCVRRKPRKTASMYWRRSWANSMWTCALQYRSCLQSAVRSPCVHCGAEPWVTSSVFSGHGKTQNVEFIGSAGVLALVEMRETSLQPGKVRGDLAWTLPQCPEP